MKILSKFQMQCWEYSICIMVDFHQVMNIIQDRYNVQKGSTKEGVQGGETKLANLVKEMGLCDSWCLRDRDTNVFSCFSRTYDTFSRLDMLLCTEDLLPKIQDIKYLPSVLSDQSPIPFSLLV